MYDLVDFPLAIGETGDCFDRYLIRIHEMYISAGIVQSILLYFYENTDGVSGGLLFDTSDEEMVDKKVTMSTRAALKTSMESLIMHFKLFSEGLLIDNSATYFSAETPKGELGVFLEFESEAQPSRCKIRSPGYYHLQGLDFMARNHLIADLVTIIGTQDIVFGEIDR
jgi:NADH:ubiquinone oxidoreductase subunit D